MSHTERALGGLAFSTLSASNFNCQSSLALAIECVRWFLNGFNLRTLSVCYSLLLSTYPKREWRFTLIKVSLHLKHMHSWILFSSLKSIGVNTTGKVARFKCFIMSHLTQKGPRGLCYNQNQLIPFHEMLIESESAFRSMRKRPQQG